MKLPGIRTTLARLKWPLILAVVGAALLLLESGWVWYQHRHSEMIDIVATNTAALEIGRPGTYILWNNDCWPNDGEPMSPGVPKASVFQFFKMPEEKPLNPVIVQSDRQEGGFVELGTVQFDDAGAYRFTLSGAAVERHLELRQVGLPVSYDVVHNLRVFGLMMILISLTWFLLRIAFQGSDNR